MATLEIFQNGNSMHPDTMGDPVYQIGTKNADGEYDVVVFDAMTKSQAAAKLAELQPVKSKPASEPKAKAPKKKVSTKDAAKKKAKKTAKKKKASAKKKKKR
jgi:hypothetical protein